MSAALFWRSDHQAEQGSVRGHGLMSHSKDTGGWKGTYATLLRVRGTPPTDALARFTTTRSGSLAHLDEEEARLFQEGGQGIEEAHGQFAVDQAVVGGEGER